MLPNMTALPAPAADAQPFASPAPPEDASRQRAEAPHHSSSRHPAADTPRYSTSRQRADEAQRRNPYIWPSEGPERSATAIARAPIADVATTAEQQRAETLPRLPPLSWRASARLGIAGLGLAALFGAAAGARYGLGSALLHGAGTPLAFAAVALVVVPSLFVAFAYVDVEITPREVGSICARALLAAGTLLAGLAPAMLMLAVSAENDISATLLAWLGLLSAGCLALRRTVGGLDRAADDEQLAPTVARRFLLSAFCVVAAITALRIWWLAMPMLGGGR